MRYNYFIGYGSGHDSKLLGILSDFEKGSYHYIDAIEKAGFVFGEILHNITHKLLYNCEIVVEHGVIYNYNTNLYTNRLFIGDIVGESNKVYHLFTDTPSTCYVHLKSIEPLEIHIFQEKSLYGTNPTGSRNKTYIIIIYLINTLIFYTINSLIF